MPHSPIRRLCPAQPMHLQPLPLPRSVCGQSGYASDACRVAGRPRLGLCGFNGQHRPSLLDSIYPRVPRARNANNQQHSLGAEFHGSLLGRQTIPLRLAPVDLNQSPACHCQTPPAIHRGERRFGHATRGISRQMWRVSGFLLLEPVRDQLACKHDLQSRHGVALAEGHRMTRGEIDYVASNRSIDPRGIRSAE